MSVAMETRPRVPTGISGLDEVLNGGIKRSNVVLIEGAPGTGKSTLGLECLYRGATEFDEPGLMVSFEVAPEKVVEDTEEFGWKIRECIEVGKLRVISTTPAMLLEEIQSTDGVFAAEIRKIGAKRILIDGLASFRTDITPDSERRFRAQLSVLMDGLRRHNVTVFVTNEAQPAHTAAMGHERFVCDTIISLRNRISSRHLVRSIEITKSRGHDYVQGEHTLRITAGQGVEVFPRTQARVKNYQSQRAPTRRISIGVPALDQLLGGGLYEESVTLVVGISGAGKTLLGNQFLMTGAERNEVGLVVTLDEQPQQIVRNAENAGIQIGRAIGESKVKIVYDSPLELELDVHFDKITKAIQDSGARRVVMDSIGSYENFSVREGTDFVYAMMRFFKNSGVTAILNYETPELLGICQISEDLKASHLVDNIILLSYVEISTQLRRAITIPKVRGSSNIQQTLEYIIDGCGIRLIEEPAGSGQGSEIPQLPFSRYSGILARPPGGENLSVVTRSFQGPSKPIDG